MKTDHSTIDLGTINIAHSEEALVVFPARIT
jgi:hypothetical protein